MKNIVPLAATAILLSSGPAHAFIVLSESLTVTSGTIVTPVRKKIATGYVALTDPFGNTSTLNMPVQGGVISLTGGMSPPPVQALATARVDLAKQRKSSAWIVRSDSGWTAVAKADIDVQWAALVTEITTIDYEFFFFKSLGEQVDSYFGPDVEATIEWRLRFVELNSGLVLFDSISNLSNNSPSLVFDNSGAVTWKRSPGPFGGVSGVDPTLHVPPTDFSNNRWLMSLAPQTIRFSATYMPGENLNKHMFALIMTTSGSVTDGSGWFGVSDTIPEPGTWAMLIVGFGLVGHAARRRRVSLA